MDKEWQHRKRENVVSQILRKICFKLLNVDKNIKSTERETGHLL